MGLDEMISEAKKNNQLLKYEDKIYSTSIILKIHTSNNRFYVFSNFQR